MQRVKLSREILPYALLGVIELWWLYALLGVIDLWWLYGWHVGVTALVAFCGIAFALYKKVSQARESEARHEIISDNSFMPRASPGEIEARWSSGRPPRGPAATSLASLPSAAIVPQRADTDPWTVPQSVRDAPRNRR